MARSTPAVYTGSIGAGAGAGSGLGPAWRAAINSYQVGGVAPWTETVINATPGANYQIRFHSVGDRTLGAGGNIGDADIWLDIFMGASSVNSVYQILAYQGSAASRPAMTASATLYSMSPIASALTWWLFIDNYEIFIVVTSGGNIALLGGGCMLRSEQVEAGGVGRVSVLNNGTGTVTYAVDRDISPYIFIGNVIWLQDGTKAEQGTVTAVTTNSVTVSGIVTGGYAAGSLIGRDPSPNYCFGVATTSTTSISSATLNITPRADGGYSGSTNTAQQGTLRSTAFDLLVTNSESDNDPGADGSYRIHPAYFVGGTTPYRDLRCVSSLAAYATFGAQAQGDRLLLNGDSTKKYTCFPSVTANITYILAVAGN